MKYNAILAYEYTSFYILRKLFESLNIHCFYVCLTKCQTKVINKLVVKMRPDSFPYNFLLQNYNNLSTNVRNTNENIRSKFQIHCYTRFLLKRK